MPRRVSKIKVRGDVRRYPSQKIMAPLSTRVRKVTLPTLATDSSSIPQPYKPHSFKGRRQNSFGTMTAQAAVEDMAVNCSPAKSTSSPKSQTEV